MWDRLYDDIDWKWSEMPMKQHVAFIHNGVNDYSKNFIFVC
jgi:hypothetical protein